VSDPETIRTAISTAGAILIALFGAWGTVFGVRRARRRRRAEVSDEEQEAVARWSADPGQFVKDVLESNKQMQAEVKSYRDEVKALRDELGAFKQEDRRFRTALARWVGQIMNAWGVEPEMPYPEGEDAVTLADVIPSALEATRPRPPRPAQ